MDVKRNTLFLILLQISAIFPLLSSTDQLNQNHSATDFPVQLGCGYDQTHSAPPSTAGVLGLGNDKSSFLSQLRSQNLLQNVAKADEIAKLMNENEQLKAVIEDLKETNARRAETRAAVERTLNSRLQEAEAKAATAEAEGDVKTFCYQQILDHFNYKPHRYYGKSVPFGSREEAFKNASTRGYFNSAQALADYAQVLIHIKKTLHAENSPVIVFGGSYGGMLATWFRLKYPHLAIGALASSAPILYFDNITPQDSYYSVVSRDFRDVSETCYETVRNSWSEIERVASQPNGLEILSQRFNTCRVLKRPYELIAYLQNMYAYAAQYDFPPRYQVGVICDGIDGASSFGNDILSKIYAGVVAYRGNSTCKVNNGPSNISESTDGWGWQACSEMVIPLATGNNSMFQPAPFNLQIIAEVCKELFGVSPRPHWVTTYYGGQNIKLVLRRFASNIIFSNGLRDPYSSGGVLENISHTLVAVNTVNGSHCLDLVKSNHGDPKWLINQRKKEIKIIKGWITQYYGDLHAL